MKNKKTTTEKKKRTIKNDLVDLIVRLVIIAVIIWAVFTFVFGLFVNNGVGMEPSIQDRDIIIYYRLDKHYITNEAVVYEAKGKLHLGRIIAQGGDTVEITDRGLEVNGYVQQDYKNKGDTLAVRGGTGYPVTLADDEVFILGDNRENTLDSRMFGAVKLANIKGIVQLVIRRRDI